IMTSLEGMALGQRIPAWIAMWSPNAVFATGGLVLLIAATQEWRPARIRHAWDLIEGVRHLFPWWREPGRDPSGVEGKRGWTHILDRYLIREFSVFVGIGLGRAATAFVIVDLFQTFDRYLRLKPPLIYILEHFVYRLPAALYDGLPVVMLVATIFLF